MSSVSNQAIIPVQDLLGLGTEARMNVPSFGDGNWQWRYQYDDLTEELSDLLKTLVQLYGRSPLVKDGEMGR